MDVLMTMFSCVEIGLDGFDFVVNFFFIWIVWDQLVFVDEFSIFKIQLFTVSHFFDKFLEFNVDECFWEYLEIMLIFVGDSFYFELDAFEFT